MTSLLSVFRNIKSSKKHSESTMTISNIIVYPPIGQVSTVGTDLTRVHVIAPHNTINVVELAYRVRGEPNYTIEQMTEKPDMTLGKEKMSVFVADVVLNDDIVDYAVRCGKTKSDLKWTDGSNGEYPLEVGTFHYIDEFTTMKQSLTLDDLFDGHDTELKVDNVSSNIFRITSPGGSYPNDSTSKTLGKPNCIVQYLAWVRAAPYWLQPRTGSSDFTFNERGVGLLYQRSDGYHVAILGLSGLPDSCTTYLRPDSDPKSLQLYGQNDSQRDQPAAIDVLIAYGTDVEVIMKQLFDTSKQLIYGKVFTDDMIVKSSSLDWSPEWYDGFMYCTWNGLGLNMTHDKIINALQDLNDIGLRIDGIIIDDGWQSTTGDRQLYDFEAKEGDFPTGLKGLVKDIKTKFPYINNIGVWSTVVGYWNGFIPDSKVDKMFNTIDVPYQSSNKTIRIPRPDQAKAFYEKYFSFLASAGITCVKIDNQATFDEIQDPILRGKYWRTWQNELRAAAVKYFDGKIIYCMAMVPDIMLYSMQKPLKNDETTPVFRNSDDFFPNDFQSHFWHQYCNIYNSVFTKNLLALPDYDMFQSKMEGTGSVMYERFPVLHAAVRAISGGPIYFTDTPERHNVDLLKSFSAKDCHGNDIVLRLDGEPTPSNVYRPFQADDILKVTNYYGKCGVLGLFNISDKTLAQYITISDFRLPSSDIPREEYAIRSYVHGEIWKDQSRLISLETGEIDLLTAAPYVPITKNSDKKVALFGIVNNMAGCAAVHSFEFDVKPTGVLLIVNLKCFGMLAVTTNFAIDNSVEVDSTIRYRDDKSLEVSVNEKSTLTNSHRTSPLIEVKLFLPFRESNEWKEGEKGRK